MSSLFGTAQPSGGGGLFGAQTTAAPAGGAGSSLFGGGGGLFGGSQAQATQPPAQQQQGPAATSSLFGGPATNQAQQSQPAPAGGSSLFGGAGLGAARSTGGPFLSGTTLGTALGSTQPQQASMAQAATVGTTSNGQAAQPGGALFDTLLANAKKQAEGETGLEDLPSLQLGLGDLQQRLRRLAPRGRATPDRPLDGKAHYLLAASGVDPGAAVKDLDALNARAGRPDRPLGPAGGELDVEAYISGLQTKTTLGMIADGLERSMRDFDSFLEDNVTMEWEAQRKRIYEHFGIKQRDDADRAGAAAAGPGRDEAGGFGRSKRARNAPGTPSRSTQRNSGFGRSNLLRSVIGTPSRIGTHPAQFVDVEMASPSAGGGGGYASDDRFLKEKQKRFIEKVHQLNDSRMAAQPFPILHEFAEVTAKSGDVHAPKIVDAYMAMAETVGEHADADPSVPGATARERQFAASYIGAQPRSQEAVELRKRILAGATRYLEKQFFREVESTIAKAPLEASLGGRPDVVSKIRAYIRVLAAKKNLKPDGAELQQVQGEYVWAVVFYLLRTGHVSEAATFVNDHQSQFRSVDRTFPGYINSYASSEDRRLKRPMQERCSNEYTQRVRNAPENSIDPYRMACYKIVGRCDLSSRSFDGLRTDVSDWLWLQFSLAREGDRATELASESYGLAELQASIQEIGIKHFTPKAGGGGGGSGTATASPPASAEDAASSGAFGMFFFMQMLAGMYEAAVAYLYAFARVDAVHFAVALEYYGLLRPADALSVANELKSFNTRGQMQINFAPLVGLYTQDFRAADVAAAVDYIVLLCLNMDDGGSASGGSSEAGRRQAALCHEGLRALVLETREFSKLIGDIRPDGHRIRGMIEERGKLVALDDEEEFLRTISLEAARAAEESGRTTDAVLLNHLAGDYDAVVGLVSRSLSEAVSMEMGEEMRLAPVRPRVEGVAAEAQVGTSLSLASIDDPVELARTMLTMYERDNMFRHRISDQNRSACGVLLQMSEIRGLVQAEMWPECLDKIRAIQILPLDAKGNPSIIRSYAAVFAGLTQPVAANVPNLVMWTTVCCAAQRKRLDSGQFTGNEAAARMLFDELKQITVDLTTYTSQLRYRFPPAILEALARAAAE